MNFIFRTQDIVRMLEHWLATPPNGYVGVTYARNLTRILLKPLDEDSADLIMSWVKADLPVLKNLSDNDFYISRGVQGIDRERYYFVIGAEAVPIELPRGALNADITAN